MTNPQQPTASAMIALTDHQKHLIEHSLGVAERGRRVVSYRNHFVASPGHSDLPALRILESAGYMKSRPAPAFSNREDIVFHVTEAGAKAAGRKLPEGK